MLRYLLLASAALSFAAPASAATQAIIVGNLIPDAATGPTGPAVILVEDGRIKDIAKGINNPFQADSVVDLSTKTLVPGLIDLHVHLTGDPGDDYRDEAVNPDEWGVVMGVKNAALTVKAGFTSATMSLRHWKRATPAQGQSNAPKKCVNRRALARTLSR